MKIHMLKLWMREVWRIKDRKSISLSLSTLVLYPKSTLNVSPSSSKNSEKVKDHCNVKNIILKWVMVKTLMQRAISRSPDENTQM